MINPARPCTVAQSDDQFFMDLHFPRWCTLTGGHYDGGTQMTVTLPRGMTFEGGSSFIFPKPFDAKLHRLVDWLRGQMLRSDVPVTRL